MLNPSLFLLVLVGLTIQSRQTKTYLNPVVDSDHPDPGVLKLDDGSYIAVTTTGNADNAFPILHSTDLVSWQQMGYVFPGKNKWPSWAASDFWAPEMHKVNNQYLVYFTARTQSAQSSLLSIGVAQADNPYGPFSDIGAPLQCNKSSNMGSIDATYIYDTVTQKNFLIWKSDGNAIGKPTDILMRELSADGLSFISSSAATYFLFTCTETWENGIVEGPWIIYRNSYYYIFFSGNGYTNPEYSIGVARSKSIYGPYEKYVKNPVFHVDYNRYSEGKNCTYVGPGHNSIVQGEQVGDLWIVYHAWLWDKIQQNPGRVMLIDQVLWTNDNWPTFSNGGYPSDTPQTAPFQSTLPNQSKFTTTNKKADQYQSNIVKTLRKQ